MNRTNFIPSSGHPPTGPWTQADWDEYFAAQSAEIDSMVADDKKRQKKRLVKALKKELKRQADYFSDHDAEGAWRVEGFIEPKKIIKALKKVASINECPYDCDHCRE